MAKGERFGGERSVFRDHETGREVVRITCRREWNTQPTYHVNGFVEGGRLVFAALDGGTTNLYVSDFESGEVVQLTGGTGCFYKLHALTSGQGDGEGADAFHTAAGFRSHDVFFVQGRLLKKVNADTLEEQTLFDIGTEWMCGVVELSGDESEVLLPLLDWECFTGKRDLAEYLRRCDRMNLTSRLVAVRTDGSGSRVVWEEKGRFIGHAMFSPTDSRYILADRATDPAREDEPLLWIMDVKEQRTWPMQTRNPKTGHSSWLADGGGVLSHGMVRQPDPRGGAEYVQTMELGGATRWISYHGPPRYYGHCHSTPGGTVITDAIMRPDAITAIRPRGDGCETETLCVHRTSWEGHGQLTHPHPHVSPDGRWISFGANRDGRKDLYVLDCRGI